MSNSYSAVSAPTTGTTISVTTFGSLVAGDLDFLAVSAPACRVYRGSSTSISNSTLTALTFDTERYDVGSGSHSTSSNTGRLTAPIAGVYAIFGTIEWASNATGYRQLEVRLNGTTIIASTMTAAINGTVTRQSIATDYKLAANDYVELMVAQTSGGALNVQTTGNLSPEFGWHWLRS